MARQKRQRPRRKAPARSQPSPRVSRPYQPRRAPLPHWIWFAGGAAIILILGIGAVLAVNASIEPPPGRSVNLQGSQHIQPGESHPAYNTIPPTSGWHYAGTTSWGVHTEPISNELQVHNLEHGGIMVQYNCSDCPELVAQLEGVVKRYRSKVILAPYPGMPSRIARREASATRCIPQ